MKSVNIRSRKPDQYAQALQQHPPELPAQKSHARPQSPWGDLHVDWGIRGQDLRLVLKSMATASFGRGPCLRVDLSRVSDELIPPAYVSVRWHPTCTIDLLFGEQIERDKPE